MVPFAVGITGHRSSGTLKPDNVAEITSRIEQVLIAIEDAFKSEGRSQLRLVSPLADGVDQIAARAAYDRGWSLIVPLPCAPAAYEKELPKDARGEFNALVNSSQSTVIAMDHVVRLPAEDPDDGWNKTAFEATGRMMLGLSDLLIAVWDGQRERGPGGTGQMVREADEAQIPIVWIDANDPKRVSFLKPGTSMAPTSVATASLDAEIKTQINSIVALPAPATIGKKTIDLCTAFMAEDPKTVLSWRERFLLGFYTWFYDWVAPHKKKSPSNPVQVNHGAVATTYKEVGTERDTADQLAIRYGSFYRSSFLVNYVLGALAVTLAMVGGVLFPENMIWGKVACGAIEMGVLVMLVLNWRKSIRMLWHEKFTDYRLLAEHLRHLQFLLPLGIVPFTRAAAHDPEHPRQHWVTWYMRKVARSAKPVNVDYSDAAYRRQMLALLADAWVHEQLDYQELIHERSEIAETWLVKWAFRLLFVTIAACAVHVVLESLHPLHIELLSDHAVEWISRVMVTFAAALPAWATAAHSIAQRAELVRLNKRSGAMVGALKSLRDRFHDLKQKEQANTLKTHEVSTLARETAVVMLQEAFDWRIQYRMGNFAP